MFNQISKGGTNSFHGAAYEYFQNNALNAASYTFGTEPEIAVQFTITTSVVPSVGPF